MPKNQKFSTPYQQQVQVGEDRSQGGRRGMACGVQSRRLSMRGVAAIALPPGDVPARAGVVDVVGATLTVMGHGQCTLVVSITRRRAPPAELVGCRSRSEAGVHGDPVRAVGVRVRQPIAPPSCAAGGGYCPRSDPKQALRNVVVYSGPGTRGGGSRSSARRRDPENTNREAIGAWLARRACGVSSRPAPAGAPGCATSHEGGSETAMLRGDGAARATCDVRE